MKNLIISLAIIIFISSLAYNIIKIEDAYLKASLPMFN